MAGSGVGLGGAVTVNTSEGKFDYKGDIYVDTSQKRGRDVWITPSGGTQDRRLGPYMFELPGTPNNEYIDLNRVQMEVTCRIVNSDGSDLDPVTDLAAPVNLLAATMWKEVETTINNSPMPSVSSMHAGMKAYMSAVLSNDQDSKNTHLMTQLFHMDSPGQFSNCSISVEQIRDNYAAGLRLGTVAWPAFPAEEMPLDGGEVETEEANGVLDPDVKTAAQIATLPETTDTEKYFKRKELRKRRLQQACAADTATAQLMSHKRAMNLTNRGFEERLRHARASDLMNLVAPLPADIFLLDNNLAPGNSVTIRMWRYPDAFLIMSYNDKRYRLEITDMRLHYRIIQRDGPVPSIETYQFSQTELGTKVVEANANVADFRMHFNGTLPKALVVGMVAADAFDGDYTKNPWQFEHHNLTKAYLNINGRQVPEMHGLQFDFARRHRNPIMMRAYNWLFDNTGRLEADRGNLIPVDSFANGTFLLAFDLTPDRCNGSHNHIEEQGYMELHLEFGHPLDYPIVVVYNQIYPKKLVNNRSTDRAIVADIVEK